MLLRNMLTCQYEKTAPFPVVPRRCGAYFLNPALPNRALSGNRGAAEKTVESESLARG